MLIRICYVFALVAISSGETMKSYPDGEWHSDGDTQLPTLIATGQTHYLPNQSSLATTYTSFQQAPKSITPVTQHFGYEKKPVELDAIPHEYIRTVLKPYAVYINEKHPNSVFSEAAPEMWPPNDVYAYSNSIEPGAAAQMPQVNHVSHVNHANHVTHLSPIGAVPQISPVASYTQLSAAKHLEPHQVPTIGPPTASYSSQTHAPYAPMAAYHLPAGAPYEQHVQTIISNKPYHAAVKHIEPHLNSIVPVHSIPSVTAYNPLSSAASYAQMSSVNPYEHIQTIVKPYPTYPVYIKEEQQHAPTYAVEQPPSPPPPPSYVPSNFWHPDALVYNKPAFTYPNSPDSFYPFYHSDPIQSVQTVQPVQNVLKHYFVKEKHPPRTFSASGANFWTATSGDGGSLSNPKNYVKHKNFLIKRKSVFNQRENPFTSS